MTLSPMAEGDIARTLAPVTRELQRWLTGGKPRAGSVAARGGTG